MQRQLASEYANQLHQLLVSVSKHYYFGSDGTLRYQKNAMDINLKNKDKSSKEHLVYYIMRDHYSGTFALRIATTKKMLPLADFLHYAWSEGTEEEKFIFGLPDAVFVPKTIATDDLFTALRSLDVMPLYPTSGFVSGVRIFRDIEQHLTFHLSDAVDHSLEGINKLRFKVYRYLIDSKEIFSKWKSNLPEKEHPRPAPAYDDFIQCFTEKKADPFHSAKNDHKGHNETERSDEKLPPFSKEKLDQAQDLVYDAWEEWSRSKRLSLVRKALRLSLYCADAYNVFAEYNMFSEERMELYEQGVKMGRLALGDLFFEENAGYFWGLIETRPYMRALAGLTGCLWKNGQRQEAISNCRELLRLNPNDNQGIRYHLINYLLVEEMNNDAEELLSNYKEATCFMQYSETLLAFRSNRARKAAESLRNAIESNRYVPAYLLGAKPVPYAVPDDYTWGSEEEAMIYASVALQAWKTTPSALTWLGEHN